MVAGDHKADKKTILIIAYVFPPFPGIGGRRWAKLAKYLTRLGYDVHVITAHNPFDEISTSLSDVKGNKNIHLHVLPAKYPRVLHGKDKGVISKISYRINLALLKLRVRGTIYDRAVFWQKSMEKKTEELIRSYAIETIVATGAPFRVLYYAVQLKNKHSNLQVIADIRDPWSWNTHAYGFPGLSEKRLAVERSMEKTVMEKADKILVPVENMKSKLESLYPQYASKIHLLRHGYDTDEIEPIKQNSKTKIRLLFYGTLYPSIEEFIEKTAVVLAAKKENVTLDIFSDSQRYHEIFQSAGANENVNYYGLLPSKELFARFKEYDYVMLVHPDYGRDNLSTKFFEIIASNLPILYVGNAGMAASYIEENKVGIWLKPDRLEEDLKAVLEKKYVFNYNFDLDISHLSFAKLAESLVQLIHT